MATICTTKPETTQSNESVTPRLTLASRIRNSTRIPRPIFAVTTDVTVFEASTVTSSSETRRGANRGIRGRTTRRQTHASMMTTTTSGRVTSGQRDDSNGVSLMSCITATCRIPQTTSNTVCRVVRNTSSVSSSTSQAKQKQSEAMPLGHSISSTDDTRQRRVAARLVNPAATFRTGTVSERSSSMGSSGVISASSKASRAVNRRSSRSSSVSSKVNSVSKCQATNATTMHRSGRPTSTAGERRSSNSLIAEDTGSAAQKSPQVIQSTSLRKQRTGGPFLVAASSDSGGALSSIESCQKASMTLTTCSSRSDNSSHNSTEAKPSSTSMRQRRTSAMVEIRPEINVEKTNFEQRIPVEQHAIVVSTPTTVVEVAKSAGDRNEVYLAESSTEIPSVDDDTRKDNLPNNWTLKGSTGSTALPRMGFPMISHNDVTATNQSIKKIDGGGELVKLFPIAKAVSIDAVEVPFEVPPSPHLRVLVRELIVVSNRRRQDMDETADIDDVIVDSRARSSSLVDSLPIGTTEISNAECRSRFESDASFVSHCDVLEDRKAVDLVTKPSNHATYEPQDIDRRTDGESERLRRKLPKTLDVDMSCDVTSTCGHEQADHSDVRHRGDFEAESSSRVDTKAPVVIPTSIKCTSGLSNESSLQRASLVSTAEMVCLRQVKDKAVRGGLKRQPITRDMQPFFAANDCRTREATVVSREPTKTSGQSSMKMSPSSRSETRSNSKQVLVQSSRPLNSRTWTILNVSPSCSQTKSDAGRLLKSGVSLSSEVCHSNILDASSIFPDQTESLSLSNSAEFYFITLSGQQLPVIFKFKPVERQQFDQNSICRAKTENVSGQSQTRPTTSHGARRLSRVVNRRHGGFSRVRNHGVTETDKQSSPKFDELSKSEQDTDQHICVCSLRHADELSCSFPVDDVNTSSDHLIIDSFGERQFLKPVKNHAAVVIDYQNALMPPCPPPDFTQTVQMFPDDEIRYRNPSTASISDQLREAIVISDYPSAAHQCSSSCSVEVLPPSDVSLNAPEIADQSVERLYDCIAVSSLNATLVELCDNKSRRFSHHQIQQDPSVETTWPTIRCLGTSTQPSITTAVNACGQLSSISYLLEFDRPSPTGIDSTNAKLKVKPLTAPVRNTRRPSKSDERCDLVANRKPFDKKTCSKMLAKIESTTSTDAQRRGNDPCCDVISNDADVSGSVRIEHRCERLDEQPRGDRDIGAYCNDVVFLTMTGRVKPIDFHFAKYERNPMIAETQKQKFFKPHVEKETSVVLRRKLPSTPNTQRQKRASTVVPQKRIQRRLSENSFNEIEHGDNQIQSSATVTLFCLPSSKQSSQIENLSSRSGVTEQLLDAMETPNNQCRAQVQSILVEPIRVKRLAEVKSAFNDDRTCVDGNHQLSTVTPFRPVQVAMVVPLKPVRLTKAKRLSKRRCSIPSSAPVISELQMTSPISVIHVAFISPLEESFQLETASSIARLLPSPLMPPCQVARIDVQHAIHVDDISRRVLPTRTLSIGGGEWVDRTVSEIGRVPMPRSRIIRVERPLRQALLIDDVQLLQCGFVESISLAGAPSLENFPTVQTPSRQQRLDNGISSSTILDVLHPVKSIASSSEQRTEASSIEETGIGVVQRLSDVSSEQKRLAAPDMDALIQSNHSAMFERWDIDSRINRQQLLSQSREITSGPFLTDGDVLHDEKSNARPYSRPHLGRIVMQTIDKDLHQFEPEAELKPSDHDGLEQGRQMADASMNSIVSENESLLGFHPDIAKNVNSSPSESRETVSATRTIPCPVASGTVKRTSHVTDVNRSRYPPVPDLAKFIPVLLPVPSLIPTISHNRVDRSEWRRAQLALDRDRYNAQLPNPSEEHSQVLRSRSDESLGCTTRRGKPGNGFANQDGVVGRNNVDENAAVDRQWSTLTLSSEETALGYPAVVEFPDVNDPRFDGRVNAEFCRVSIGVGLQPPTIEDMGDSTSLIDEHQEAANLWAELYVELPNSRSNNLTLYHLKVDLACVALKSFLEPCSQVQFSYVRNIRDKVAEAVQSELYQPKFVQFVCTAQFDCLLILSRDAGALVRHANVGLIHSLAAALDLSGADRILIMVAR